jgi:biopolymer transport protein TolR
MKQESSNLPIAHSDVKSDINVTPLVDVCLVMLIIFMVVTPMLQTGVDVPLPETSKPERVQEGKNQLTVAIKADGSVFVGQNWVPKENLLETFKDIYSSTPDKDVRIKGDRHLKYKDVRDVMQVINTAGFTKAGLITTKKEKSQE